MSPTSDSAFILALVTWLILILWTPSVIIWLWQPSKETIVSHLDLALFLLSLSKAGSWTLNHGGYYVWLASFVFFGAGDYVAVCPSCMRGFLYGQAFKPNSFFSRVILAIAFVANLRRKPWLGIPAALTIKALLILGIVFTISNAPMLLIMVGAKVLCFCGSIWLGMSYYGNSEKVFVLAIATSFGLYILTLCLVIWVSGLFFALPVVVLICFLASRHNDCSRLTGITSDVLRRAGIVTVKRLPLLVVLMIPGLCLKAGVDWSAHYVIDAVEARAAKVNMLAVPTIRKEKYPWHSPLRWLGVPKYSRGTTAVSLEKPKEAVFSAVKMTRALMNTLEIISFAILALLLARALMSMFIRELIVQGVQLNAYVPAPRKHLPKLAQLAHTDAEGSPRGEENQVPMESHASLVIDPSWGTCVFLKRTLSPTGGVPSTELPASKMAFLARLLHHCLVMDRYSLKDTTIQLDSSDGHRFIRWELNESEVLYFNFSQLVGWTNVIRFDTAPCLQVGMLAQGKMLVHRAYGPGSLIFDLNGEPGVWAHDKGATFTPDRLVACRIDVKQGDGHPDFKIIAAGGTLNSFVGTVSQEASVGTALLLDPKGRRASYSHPVFDLIRQTYAVFG